MCAKHRAVRVKKEDKTGGRTAGMLRGCFIGVVARDVQSLLAGEPSFLGKVGTTVGRWFEENPPF